MVAYNQITYLTYRQYAPRLGLDPSKINDVAVSPTESPEFDMVPEFVALHHTGTARGSVEKSIVFCRAMLNGSVDHVHYNEATSRGGFHLVGRNSRASWNPGWVNSVPFDRAIRGEMTPALWTQRPSIVNNVSPARSAKAAIGHVVDINGVDEPFEGEQWRMFVGICAIRLYLLGWGVGRQALHRTLTTRKPDIHTNKPNAQLDQELWNAIAHDLNILRGPVMPPVTPPVIPPPVLPAVPELPHISEENAMMHLYTDVPFRHSAAGCVSPNGGLGKGGSIVGVAPRTAAAGPHPVTGAFLQYWTNNDSKNGNLVGLFPNYTGDVNCDVTVWRAT